MFKGRIREDAVLENTDENEGEVIEVSRKESELQNE